MLRFTLPLCVLFVMCCVYSTTVQAWNTLTHAHLAEAAYQALPVETRESLAPYLSEIIRGSVYPDVFIQDWENHDLNILGSAVSQQAAPARVKELYDSISLELSASSPELKEVAHEMGLMSHYIADINQPLHTAQYPSEILIHTNYESDVFFWWSLYSFADSGIRYRFDPGQMVWESAEAANRYYFGILDAYLTGTGVINSQGITQLNLNRAIADIRDTWLTLWLKANAKQNQLSLWSHKSQYYPGETVRPVLSILPINHPPELKADLYIALLTHTNEWFLLNEQGESTSQIVPWRRHFIVQQTSLKPFHTLLLPETATGKYRLFALLVEADGDVLQAETGISNTASVTIEISPLPEIDLHELKNEVYLFPAHWPGTDQIVSQPVKRWDILFVGNASSTTDLLIPGDFNHIMIYLGRDNQGTPYAMEMTQSFINKVINLRLVRLPEFDTPSPNSESIALTILNKNLWYYKYRWAKRLVKSELQKVQANEEQILNQIEADWHDQIPYQLEYDWSGNFSDLAVYLVDDGFDNGAGCTDYWLTIFEQISKVCIKGSRINALELNDYYLSAEASAVTIPESLNPFPFDITAPILLNKLGFYMVDPPPHQFSCDKSIETGVPIPSRLINSPQLEAIKAEMIIKNWP